MSNFYFNIERPYVLESKRNINFYKQVFLLGNSKYKEAPDILYKYMKVGKNDNVDFTNRLLDTILEGAFWFSTKRYLNDPCEMSYVDIVADTFLPEHPLAVFSVKPLSKEVAKNFNLCRICCFSESWSEGPMWANYSGGQKGVCVGFKTSALSDCFFPVLYMNQIDKVDLLGEEGLLKAFSIKEESWSYEKEWRLIYPWTPMNIKENINDQYHGLTQSLDLPITELIFGNQVDENVVKQIMENLQEVKKVKIYRAEIKHRIERQLISF